MPAATLCQTCGKSLTHTDHGGLCGSCLFSSLLTEATCVATAGGEWQVPGYAMGPEIGRGGSAVVYRAKQYDPDRTVALKILLPIWTDGTGVRERFRLEAQALAQLDHPGILPVLASGEVEGVPWYSMPLASGGTLAERRSTAGGQFRQIAEWLACAAEAVAHAHARGVLHRDLKPGNILFSDDGRLFVSDFGLARVLATPSNVTMTAAMLGTPAYMAPEVIAHGIRSATVTADVWGLGAILYELLAGHRPFEAESIPELVRSVASDEPAPLREVPTDLAAIAFRALHKNPERRYPTVLAMADDLRAWLAGEPVTARPYPWWERLGFATKRHPVFAAALLLTVLAAVTAAIVGVRESHLRRREEAARKSAVEEAETNREILRFLQNDLLAQASPDAEPDRDIRLRTVLDRAAKAIDGRFPGKPVVEASIRQTLANTYLALGEETVAFAQAAKAIELFTREKGAEAPEILRLRHIEFYDDVIKGKLAEAEALETHVLDIQRRKLPPSDPDIYATWGDLAEVYYQMGKWDKAEAESRQAFNEATRYLDRENPQTLKLECTLAVTLASLKRDDEALAAFRHCLAAARRALGNENSITLEIMSEMLVVMYAKGDFSASLALAREVVEIKTRVLGPKHYSTVLSKTNLATMLGNQGLLREAEVLFEEGRETYIQRYGREDQRTLRLEVDLSDIWNSLGRYREAAELESKNLPLYEKIMGAEHPDLFWLKMGLAQAYDGLGQFARAIEVSEQCVDLGKRVYGETSDYALWAKLLLANAHGDAGHHATAVAMYHELQAVEEKASGDTVRVVLAVQLLGARLEISRGKFTEAEDLLREVVRGGEKHFGPTADGTLERKFDLVVLLVRRGALSEAEKLLHEIVAARERDAGLDAAPTLAALDVLGLAEAMQGRWAEAEATLRRSGERWAGFEPQGRKQALNRLCLGWVLYATGRRDEAAPLLAEGYVGAKDPAEFSPTERVLRSIVAERLAVACRGKGDTEAMARWRAVLSAD